MDSTRDNLFVRFTTFWWGAATFAVFAVLLGLVWAFNHDDPESIEEAAAKPRYETKAAVDKAQAASLSEESIKGAMTVVAKELAGSKPTAVETPEQIVPGSATSKQLAAAPGPDLKAIDAVPAEASAAPDPKLMEIGKGQYLVCGACHGQNGEGTPIAPPLAGSEWVTGPVSNLVRIQFRGLTGPITVAGKEYNMPGGMTPLAYQTDEQVAAVLTYIRSSFGNKASAVKVEQVTPLRGEAGKPQLTAAELTKP